LFYFFGIVGLGWFNFYLLLLFVLTLNFWCLVSFFLVWEIIKILMALDDGYFGFRYSVFHCFLKPKK